MQPAGSDDSAWDAEIPMMREEGSRARRLTLDLPVRYRSPGSRRWREGRVENISRSGLLLRGVDLLDVDTAIEMTLVLPAQFGTAIVCRGRVVRTVLPGGIERRPGLAATISRYRFRGPRNLA
jgi:PilZ domain